MLAFFFILLIVALLVERWSLRHALSGVKYDVRLSKQLMEIDEKILAHGDIDGDGLTVMDATLIQRHLSHTTVPYPIGIWMQETE